MTDVIVTTPHLPPATDDSALERLKRFGGAKLLGEMIALFLATVPERLDAARAGVTASDAKQAELALHSLKSSAAQLGALQMQRLAERGEALAREGTIEAVAPLVYELEAEFPRVQHWLENARPTETP